LEEINVQKISLKKKSFKNEKKRKGFFYLRKSFGKRKSSFEI